MARLRSPFIHSLVWFQPWIENAVEPWRRERGHDRARQEQIRQRQMQREESEAKHSPPPVTSFEEFSKRYKGRRFLPPPDVLCQELATFAPELATRYREQGYAKIEILKECQSSTARTK